MREGQGGPWPEGLVFVTGSGAKLREVRGLLGRELEGRALDLPEIQSVEVEEVVARKAEAAFALVGGPVLVEDTGLFIHAWNGLPGALVRWFLERVGAEGICAMLHGVEDRRAVARTVFALYDGRLRVAVGETEGTIAPAPMGAAGFGWDSIFVPRPGARSFAQMTAEEKARCSMRARALARLREQLGPT